MRIDFAADDAMASFLRREPVSTRSPWKRLLGAVMRLAGPRAELVMHAERPWASATFSGTRHHVTLVFEGADGVAEAERLIEALPDHEFAISGQLVADAAVVSVAHVAGPPATITIEAELLLLDDA